MHRFENLVIELQKYLKLEIPVRYFAAFDGERDDMCEIVEYMETHNIYYLTLDDHCVIPCFITSEDLLCFILKYKDVDAIHIDMVIYLIAKIKLICDEYSVREMKNFGLEMRQIAINTFYEYNQQYLLNEAKAFEYY